MKRFATIFWLGVMMLLAGCGGRIESASSGGTRAADDPSSGSTVSGSDSSAQSVENDGTCDGATWNPLATVKLPQGVDYLELRSFDKHWSTGTACVGATGEGIDVCRQTLDALDIMAGKASNGGLDGPMLPNISPSAYNNELTAVAIVTRGSSASALSQQELVDLLEPVSSFGNAVLVASLTGNTVACPQNGARALSDGGFTVRVYGCVTMQEADVGTNLVEITRNGAVQSYAGARVPDASCFTGG
jgi:hypothetical protein